METLNASELNPLVKEVYDAVADSITIELVEGFDHWHGWFNPTTLILTVNCGKSSGTVRDDMCYQSVLIHELTHAKQVVEGRLVYDTNTGTVTFDGVDYPCLLQPPTPFNLTMDDYIKAIDKYDSQPWEAESLAAEHRLECDVLGVGVYSGWTLEQWRRYNTNFTYRTILGMKDGWVPLAPMGSGNGIIVHLEVNAAGDLYRMNKVVHRTGKVLGFSGYAGDAVTYTEAYITGDGSLFLVVDGVRVDVEEGKRITDILHLIPGAEIAATWNDTAA